MYNHIGSQLSFKCWCFFNKSASTIVIKGMWYWYWPVRLIHCDGYVTWKWQLIITCQARSYRHVSQQTINMYTVQINTIQACAQMQVYQFKCLKVFWHSLAPHSLLICFYHKNTCTKYKWEWTLCVHHYFSQCIKQKPQFTASAGLCHMGEHNFMEMSFCCM